MRYTEEELLEAVDILVEEYGIDEDEAIDLVNETCEMELYSEGVMNRSKIPASHTYKKLLKSDARYNSYVDKGKRDKAEKQYNRSAKLENKLKRQVGEFNEYQNKKLIKRARKGKSLRNYQQIELKKK